MGIDIGKTSAVLAEVIPSARDELKGIGVFANARMGKLTEGVVVLVGGAPYVVLRTEHDTRRRGSRSRMIVRVMDGASVRSVPYDTAAWMTRLTLSADMADLIRLGDIVRYPGALPEHGMVAIRQQHGWMRTAAPWAPYADAEVLLHLREGRATVLRSALCSAAIPPRGHYPTGSVVACRDLKTTDPTVWIRTGEDYWVSHIRGVTASDVMINYEVDRRTYHVVWVPEEDR